MQPKTKSIFDLIEEKSATPTTFAWSDDLEKCKYSSEEYIYEGELCVPGGPGLPPSRRRYVLTLSGLIKYKVNIDSSPVEIQSAAATPVPALQEPAHVQGRGLQSQTALFSYLPPKNSYGIRLTGYQGQCELYAESREEQEIWAERLKRICICANISAYYGFGKMIGKGNFAKVHIARKKANEQIYAVKTIEKAKIAENPKNLISLEKEIQVMRRIDHPNVIKMYEVYENELYIHLILEYLRGGELFQLIQLKGIYSEKDAAIAIHCVLSALAYCHDRNIIHRDLKPENLILVYDALSDYR